MASLFVVLPLLAVLLNPDPKSLDQKIAATMPKPDEERWLQVPWRTHLMQARKEAQEAKKPVFLWIMVGNPQGCT